MAMNQAQRQAAYRVRQAAIVADLRARAALATANPAPSPGLGSVVLTDEEFGWLMKSLIARRAANATSVK